MDEFELRCLEAELMFSIAEGSKEHRFLRLARKLNRLCYRGRAYDYEIYSTARNLDQARYMLPDSCAQSLMAALGLHSGELEILLMVHDSCWELFNDLRIAYDLDNIDKYRPR